MEMYLFTRIVRSKWSTEQREIDSDLWALLAGNGERVDRKHVEAKMSLNFSFKKIEKVSFD